MADALKKVKAGHPLKIPLTACVAKIYDEGDFAQLRIRWSLDRCLTGPRTPLGGTRARYIGCSRRPLSTRQSPSAGLRLRLQA